MSEVSKGIIYVATGPRFIAECIRSVHSLRNAAPTLDITIFTDRPEEFQTLAKDSHVHTTTLPDFRRSFADKILALQHSPYEKTLFLDADTTVFRDPSEVFEILEQFDIAATLETYQPRSLPGVPAAFPEFNAGAILFRRSAALKKFLCDWSARYSEHLKLPTPIKGEQPAFREVLYHSPLRFAPLPVVFNFHAEHPIILPAGAAVSVFHGRLDTSKFPCSLLRPLPESRVFLPNAACLKPARLTSFSGLCRVILEAAMMPVRVVVFVRKQWRA